MASTSPATSIISEHNFSRHYIRSNNDNLHARSSADSTQNRLVPPKTPVSFLTTQAVQQIPVEERKPRMVINKMTLNNFKSYYGKQEIGPFHKVWFFLSFCATVIL
jgi:hypothetical protein